MLINIYCPAVRDKSRFEFKMLFLKLLRSRIDDFLKAGRYVIVLVRMERGWGLRTKWICRRGISMFRINESIVAVQMT